MLANIATFQRWAQGCLGYNRVNSMESTFYQVLRRGALMLMLQQSAVTLPLWIGSPGETPPALCGAVSAGADYIAKPNDKVKQMTFIF